MQWHFLNSSKKKKITRYCYLLTVKKNLPLPKIPDNRFTTHGSCTYTILPSLEDHLITISAKTTCIRTHGQKKLHIKGQTKFVLPLLIDWTSSIQIELRRYVSWPMVAAAKTIIPFCWVLWWTGFIWTRRTSSVEIFFPVTGHYFLLYWWYLILRHKAEMYWSRPKAFIFK